MQTVVAPEILQLLAVGADDSDHYLRPGRHLRWLPNPLLGFPRRGFVLRRRPSPGWPWGKRADMLTAGAMIGEEEGAALWLAGSGPLSAGEQEQSWERGIRVTSPGGAVRPEDGKGVVVPRRGLMLELQARAGMTRPDPAAWVALRVAGDREATVSATAWAQGGPGKEDSVLSEVTELLGALPLWEPTHNRAEYVVLLDGGLIDAVELHADGQVWLQELRWLPVDRYAAAPGWTDIGRFLLPVDGDGADYPSQPDADAVAEARVDDAVTKAQPPWEDRGWPPAPADRDEVAADLRTRHLDRLGGLQGTLSDILDAEIAQVRPQGAVQLDPADGEALELEQSGDEADMRLPGVPLLLAASLEAAFAHLLGLATVDGEAGPDVPYDYCVSAVYPTLWMAWLMGSELSEVLSRQSDAVAGAILHERAREAVVPPLPPEELEDDDTRFLRAVSVATGVTPGPLADPPPPERTAVDVRPDPGAAPVPARAELSWRAPDQPTFDNLPVVGFTADREDARGWVSLARTDPVAGHRLPHLSGADDRLLRDSDLRAEGQTRWTVRSLDIWGRWGKPAEAIADVADEVPPPPPSGVVATLRGNVDENADTVERIIVGFDWGSGQAALAPDLDRFEVALAASVVSADDALAQGTSFEVAADASAVDPEGQASRQALDGGGHRIEVTIPNATAAASGHRWETTAVVRAVDEAGNRSRPAHALAELVEEAQPAVPDAPPGVQLTSWPDADGLGWWTCRWEAEEGARVQVLRAAGSRLLAAAGHEDRSALADKSLEEQAAFLRDLAVDHPHAFSPDHPRSHPHPVSEHPVSVDGSSRDLTLVVVIPTGPTGTRAAWPEAPEAFAAIAARRLDALAPPRLVARADGDAVELLVEGQSGAERARVWRTADPAHADDLRRMRPLAPVAVDSDGAAELVDEAVTAGTWYAYRAAVEAPDGRRSEPTAPVWVRAR